MNTAISPKVAATAPCGDSRIELEQNFRSMPELQTIAVSQMTRPFPYERFSILVHTKVAFAAQLRKDLTAGIAEGRRERMRNKNSVTPLFPQRPSAHSAVKSLSSDNHES